MSIHLCTFKMPINMNQKYESKTQVEMLLIGVSVFVTIYKYNQPNRFNDYI